MGKQEKLLEKILRKPIPKNFTWQELTALLSGYGYEVYNNNGSARKFIHKDNDMAPIIVHEPHPGSIIKCYVIKNVITHLKQYGDIPND